MEGRISEMKEQMFEEFTKLIDASIAVNAIQRKVYEKYSTRYTGDAINYALNFCTVDVNVGRGTGKTQYIIDHAGPDDLVLVGQERFKAHFKAKNSQAIIMCCHEVQNCRAPLTRFKKFYIDEPYMVFPRRQDLHEFYFKSATEKGDQTYIFLGISR
jgi:hypothetical protein